MKKIMSLVFLLFLVSCSSTPDSTQEASPSVGGCGVSSTEPYEGGMGFSALREEEEFIEKIYAYPDFNFIKAYGVDKDRIIKIVSAINPEYFEGVSQLEVIYSKSNSKTADCWYYTDNAKITCYIDWESDEWIKRNILHELSHHYCWKQEKYLGHDSCFLKALEKIQNEND